MTAVMVLINLPISLTRSYLIKRLYHKGSFYLLPMSHYDEQLPIKIDMCSNNLHCYYTLKATHL
uniref:Uncharacterized protein n=1 Tax=Picea glauca TaxID=3330 RepID=A0A101LZE3_PICGL|nr:hypothetical protein ABT39_MTgene5024 [Picea glauca]